VSRRLTFSADSPLGYRVVLTRNRWREIVRFKHPALAGKEAEVRLCVSDPEIIRASAKNPDTHLHYRASSRGYICVVVAPGDKDHFVVTAYLTAIVKRGQTLWTK
jgi:hypothetical protein